MCAEQQADLQPWGALVQGWDSCCVLAPTYWTARMQSAPVARMLPPAMKGLPFQHIGSRPPKALEEAKVHRVALRRELSAELQADMQFWDAPGALPGHSCCRAV